MTSKIKIGDWNIRFSLNDIEFKIECDSIYEEYRYHLELAEVPQNLISICDDLKQMNEMFFNHGSISLEGNLFIMPLFFGRTKREVTLELKK